MTKHIHFVGIKGVGMAPLAVIASQVGVKVSGSDIEERFITDITLEAAGIVPAVGFSPEHVLGAEMVITTGAHGGMDNPEVVYAQEHKIPVLLQGEAVGRVMSGELFGKKYHGVSVAGTHGKTTTTAMIATMLVTCGRDPGFLIGTGEVPSLGKAGQRGSGNYFVAEADEYATDIRHSRTPKFLWQHPEILVITNIEFDHPDFYHDLAEMEEAYRDLCQNVLQGGVIIACGDSQNVLKILKDSGQRYVTYGFLPHNDYVLGSMRYSEGMQHVEFRDNSGNRYSFVLKVAGKHNALNALAAYLVGKEIGLKTAEIQTGLTAFKGSKRRLEYRGRLSFGADLYDDYAHHPTEIQMTLEAIREMYPTQKIVCIFQPHMYSRTKELLKDFIDSLKKADTIIITEIYASLREERDPNFSARLIADGIGNNSFFLKSLSDVIKYVTAKKYDANYVLVTMGAGDVYTIGENLLNN